MTVDSRIARVQVRQIGRWRYEIVLTCGISTLRGDAGYPVRWGRKRAIKYAERLLAEYVGQGERPVVVADMSAPMPERRTTLPPPPPPPGGYPSTRVMDRAPKVPTGPAPGGRRRS